MSSGTPWWQSLIPRRLLAQARQAEHAFMVLLAVVIGVLGGLGAVGFRLLIKGVQHLVWGAGALDAHLIQAHPWWWIALAPAVGGALVGLIAFYLAHEARGAGVPEVVESVILRSGVIRPILLPIKSVASALSIGTGGSVGREGPIVEIGSALASSLGQWLQVPGSQLRTLAASGAAAGIAATFNAPLAGALFAVEVILGNFAVTEFSAIVISSVSATVVSHHFLGTQPLFGVPPYSLVSPWEAVPYALLGVVAAAVSLVFVWAVYAVEDVFDRLPVLPWIATALGGLLVGMLALLHPQVMGVGYPVTEAAVWGRLSLGLVLILVPAKLLATSLTLGSGGSGGIFGPSLFMGALSGTFVGSAAHLWFPDITGSVGGYALVGMGAVVGSATQAPLTAILMIFELTSDYRMILPLMAAVMIATLITSRVRRESIYTLKLVRRGVNVFRGQSRDVLRSLRVADVMRRDVATIRKDERIGTMLHGLGDQQGSLPVVVDDDGKFVGMIQLRALRKALLNAHALGELVVAGELAERDVPTLSPEDNLDTGSRAFAGRDLDELPVVDRESGELVGAVPGHELMSAYDRELRRQHLMASVGGGLDADAGYEVALGSGYRMVQKPAPPDLVGHTLRELDLRSRHDITVLLIRRAPPTPGGRPFEVVPGPETVVERGDALVVVGTREALTALE
jgi:CIC family chloride channel protein